MKRNLMTLAAVSAIALGGFALVQAQPGHGGGGQWHGHGFGLERLTKGLNLTADQKTTIGGLLETSTKELAELAPKGFGGFKGGKGGGGRPDMMLPVAGGSLVLVADSSAADGRSAEEA